MRTWTKAARSSWDEMDGLRSDCYEDGRSVGFVIRKRLDEVVYGGRMAGSVIAYRFESPESVYRSPKFVASAEDFRTARRLMVSAA